LSGRSDSILTLLGVGDGEQSAVVVSENQVEPLPSTITDRKQRHFFVRFNPEQKPMGGFSRLLKPTVAKRCEINVKHHQVVDEDRMRCVNIASFG
jgi:hypothetical protein